VKEEDTDWMVYHRIPENSAVSEEDLKSACGLDPMAIAASLDHLERSCLIERSNGAVRMLNFGESLLRNQFRYEKDLPFVIENGVIKEKKK
jgi:predicted transcriptional regulator